MEKLKEYATVYSIGSLGYTVIEVLWRGFTHWTMGITGGVGFMLLHFTNRKLKRQNYWVRCFAGSVVLTAVEFISGCIVNRILRLHVWDYSKQRGNLLGQICPLYSLLWFLLCLPIIPFNRFLQRKIFPKP
ncbi:hypothetical protein V6615_13750 [Oscillospiraceae bacterium PP1C4]